MCIVCYKLPILAPLWSALILIDSAQWVYQNVFDINSCLLLLEVLLINVEPSA